MEGWTGGMYQLEGDVLVFGLVNLYLPSAIPRLDRVKVVLEERLGQVHVLSKDACVISKYVERGGGMGKTVRSVN